MDNSGGLVKLWPISLIKSFFLLLCVVDSVLYRKCWVLYKGVDLCTLNSVFYAEEMYICIAIKAMLI